MIKSNTLILAILLAAGLAIAQSPGGSPAAGQPEFSAAEDSGNPKMPFGSPGFSHKMPQPGDTTDKGMLPPHPDIFENLYQPEMVMMNQKALNVTEAQTSAIKAEMSESGARFFDLVWQESAIEETLQSMLKEEKLSSEEILPAFDKLLGIENEIKRLRLKMMITVRNQLTPEQRKKMQELTKSGGRFPMPGGFKDRSDRMPPVPTDGAPPPPDGVSGKPFPAQKPKGTPEGAELKSPRKTPAFVTSSPVSARAKLLDVI